MKTIVYTDGATSETNPGPAGAGAAFFFEDELEPFLTLCEPLGISTSNVAEYRAVVLAIEKWILEIADADHQNLDIRTDSALIANQVNGSFATKSKGLRPLQQQVLWLQKIVERAGGEITISYVPREQNEDADILSKEAAALARDRVE